MISDLYDKQRFPVKSSFAVRHYFGGNNILGLFGFGSRVRGAAVDMPNIGLGDVVRIHEWQNKLNCQQLRLKTEEKKNQFFTFQSTAQYLSFGYGHT